MTGGSVVGQMRITRRHRRPRAHPGRSYTTSGGTIPVLIPTERDPDVGHQKTGEVLGKSKIFIGTDSCD